jgi:hypothetical protein
MPHGGPVRIEEKIAFPETDLTAIDGITKRPRGAGHIDHHEIGEQLLVCTDGGLLAQIGEHPRWVDLKSGKILP